MELNGLQRFGLSLQGPQGQQVLMEIEKQKQEQQRAAALQQIAQEQFGGDPALVAIAQSNPDVFAALIAKKYATQFEPKSPQSSLAKLSADYKAGFIPKEAYDAAIAKETAPTKEQKDQSDQLKGRQSVETSLSKVMKVYNELDQAAAIPSTKRSPVSNVFSSIGAAEPATLFGYEIPTPYGQDFGRFIGSENQSKRDFIKNARTLILQDIKNATGMSAQQMNSNAELQTFLSSLGDPRQSIETIKETISNMSEKYGTGALAGKPRTDTNYYPSQGLQKLSDKELLEALGQ